MQQLLEQLSTLALSAKGLATLGVFTLSALALVLGENAVRRRRVALATYHAFHVVEDLAAECRATGRAFPFLDKASAGLRFADDWMRTNGWRGLKPEEQGRAQLAFKSMHGEAKAAQREHEELVATARASVESSGGEGGSVARVLALCLLVPLAAQLTGCAPLHRGEAALVVTAAPEDFRPQATPEQCQRWDEARFTWGAVGVVAGALGGSSGAVATLTPLAKNDGARLALGLTSLVLLAGTAASAYAVDGLSQRYTSGCTLPAP